jgi:putative endopeptidase
LRSAWSCSPAPVARRDRREEEESRQAQGAAAPTGCTDFYSVANADWLKAQSRARERRRVRDGRTARTQLQQQRDCSTTRCACRRATCRSCSATSGRAAWTKPRSNATAPIPSRRCWRASTHQAREGHPAGDRRAAPGRHPVAFNFGADIDLRDLSATSVTSARAAMGLVDPAFYTRTDADTRAVMARYDAYVQKLLLLVGHAAGTRRRGRQARHRSLKRASRRPSKPLGRCATTAPTTRRRPSKDLGKTVQAPAARRIPEGAGLQRRHGVDRQSAAVRSNSTRWPRPLPPSQWQAYLRFHVGNAMAPYLSKAWRDAEFEFRGRVLRASPRRRNAGARCSTRSTPRLARCSATNTRRASCRRDEASAPSRSPPTCVRARSRVDRSPWMGASAKTEAKAKLDKLKIEIGTPRRDLDYTVQPMGRGSFGGNMLIASTWRHREEMKRIGRGNADRRWDVLPQQPTLAYDIAQNRLIVTAAMLQPPVLDANADPASQYGAYGALVGMELAHAIDGKGRLVDAAGTLRDWWTPRKTMRGMRWASAWSRSTGRSRIRR